MSSGLDAESHNVYFGDITCGDIPVTLVCTTTTAVNICKPTASMLEPGRKYKWRVDTVTTSGLVIQGNLTLTLTVTLHVIGMERYSLHNLDPNPNPDPDHERNLDGRC